MAVISELMKYPRLVFGLRDYLHGTITLEQSKDVISSRLHNRENNFLSLLRTGIYGNPNSPYLKLLNVAGCHFEDIERLVARDGVEAALGKLLADGVYLSWEEFKGKKDVVRGGTHFRFKDTDYDNHLLPAQYQVQSSGSRSAGSRTQFDLRHQMETTYYHLMMLAANNALEAPMGLWHPGFPSSAGISALLKYYKIGKPIARWFSPVGEGQVHASFKNRLATRYIVYGSRLWGAKLARPEYVGLDQAYRVARWMAETRRSYGGCSISCFVSPAVMICRAALDNGLDISGTRFFVGGEPLTEAKRHQIEAAGALVTPRYFITEVGIIGSGCSQGGADDIHLLHDSVALIQHQRTVEHADRQVDAFVLTSILPSTPKIMFNVEIDDYGVMETRGCDCLFGHLGFGQHLHGIRSYAKLTGVGMTIMGSDFVRILEKVLPHKYGGAATDYQLVEEEDSGGDTRLSLFISPAVGELNDGDVISTVLDELRRSAHGGKLAAGLWSQAKALRVVRRNPVSTAGKVLTLHLTKKA